MLKKILITAGVLVLAFAAFMAVELFVYPKAQTASATNRTALDFTLSDAQGQQFTLASQRGHRTVLYFYRGYW
jgi:cytochrome oxidase Cu insertion factor (SCO1/SenC/PrrC family)